MSRQARCGDRLDRDGDTYVCDRIDAHKGPHSAERWVHNDDASVKHPRWYWLKVQWVDCDPSPLSTVGRAVLRAR